MRSFKGTSRTQIWKCTCTATRLAPWTVKQTNNNDITYLMTLLCTSNCAITLRDKNNDVDLTGLATIRWRTKISGFHLLHPILKLADGTWLVGDHATAYSTDWVESEIQLVDVRWRNLNIENVVEGRGRQVGGESEPEQGGGDWFHRADAGRRSRKRWFADRLD